MTVPDTTNDGGKYVKMLNLSVREKRNWMKRLTEAQQTVEDAEDARDKLMVEAYEAGISYSNVGAATGFNGSSMSTRIERIRKRLGL